jgi:hypothetical protein
MAIGVPYVVVLITVLFGLRPALSDMMDSSVMVSTLKNLLQVKLAEDFLQSRV